MLCRMAYFPEPTDADESWGSFGEQPVEWLTRSTLPRAVSIRAALNENLSRFPDTQARRLATKLRHAWQSTYFEMIVGRYLQAMGATVEIEPVGTNGTRIDYRAKFPDGIASIEAISKVYNAAAGTELRRKREVAELIRPLVPDGWESCLTHSR